VSKVVEHGLALVQDAFGNYVVQYVIDLGDPAVCRALIEKLLGSIATLAVQKFSSNVVEKCLQLADDGVCALCVCWCVCVLVCVCTCVCV